MPTDLQVVVQYAKSDKTAPSEVFNAACRLLNEANAHKALISPTEGAQNGLNPVIPGATVGQGAYVAPGGSQ